jgi:hypothetical protein
VLDRQRKTANEILGEIMSPGLAPELHERGSLFLASYPD